MSTLWPRGHAIPTGQENCPPKRLSVGRETVLNYANYEVSKVFSYDTVIFVNYMDSVLRNVWYELFSAAER